MTWSVVDCRRFAAERLADLSERLAHVAAVGATAERVATRSQLEDTVVRAAWLHDVGYAPSAALTDFHALDGARLLATLGAPGELVSLVGYHSGAEFEAEERGLAAELARFDRPNQDNLDALILADMTTAPDGSPTSVEDRLAEILDRYSADHPVHRAVLRSRGYLAACAVRAERRIAVSR